VGAALLRFFLSRRRTSLMLEGLATTSFLWWMIPVTMLFIILVSVSATWLASGTMLKKLEFSERSGLIFRFDGPATTEK
ncbi:MAG: hypothetical protein ACI4QX_03990, partial [Lachnospiraceae bacterium]